MPLTVTRRIGAAEISILTDGAIAFPADLFPGTDSALVAAMLEAAGQAEIRTNFNAVLIRNGGRVILVDAGPRDLFGPACGFLPDALAECGVRPQDVDTLFATHLHPDHVAGMISADGVAVFPNAELVVPEADRAYWSDDSRFSGDAAGWAALARSVIAGYKDRLRPIGTDAVIAPGMTAIPLPGHTPGHCGWRLDTDAGSLMHVGDIVHAPDLQIADPEIGIAFDVDIDTARQTRRRLLAELAAEGMLFTGGHFLHPAFNRIERAGAGYRLVQP